jgi:hypothetical protein
MHLLPRDKPDGECRRNGEADGGECRAEPWHIHRPLQLVGERRMEGRQTAPPQPELLRALSKGAAEAKSARASIRRERPLPSKKARLTKRQHPSGAL